MLTRNQKMSILMVLASNLNNIKFLILKIEKIEFKNQDHMLFFLKEVMIAQKKPPSYFLPYKSTLSE